MLRLLVHLELVKGVVQVNDAESVRPCEVVSEPLWCGNGKVGSLHHVLHRTGVQVDPYLLVCPALLSDHHIVYPSPGWPPDMTPGPGICLGMSDSCLTPSVSLICCPSKLIYLLLPGLLIPRLVLVSSELFSCNKIKISITSLQRALSIYPLVLNKRKSETLIFLILTFLKKVKCLQYIWWGRRLLFIS